MIYDIRHLTTYRYDAPVVHARCTLRLTPRDTPDQQLLSSEITVLPRPSALTRRQGPFGEQITAVVVDAPHTRLKIEARSRVLVQRIGAASVAPGRAWEPVRAAAVATTALDLPSPAHYLYPTNQTPLMAPLTDYARQYFTPQRPIVEAALDFARGIQREFKYDTKATAVSTPAIEAFEARRGVCQDFSHIMLAGLRGLGLSAAYVSGYLRTIPPRQTATCRRRRHPRLDQSMVR